MRVFLTVGLWATILGCKGETPPPLPEPTTAVLAPEPTREPTTIELLAATKSLPQALGIVVPKFVDTTNEADPAAVLFAMWSAGHLTWTGLQSLAETKHALVLKDPEAERGKRNCYTGVIVEIQVDRSQGMPIYFGGLSTYGGQVLRFAAVGSTGELVQNSGAKFCGVVTGLYTYSNAGGGTTHAVYAVGLFDLPDNRARAVAGG